MSDRELLEAAARAAGWMPNGSWEWSPRAEAFRYRVGGDWVEWNPLTDDGDAFRLAVKLGMAVSVEFQVGSTSVLWGPPMGNVRESHGDDPYAATRRAIVRASAALNAEHAKESK